MDAFLHKKGPYAPRSALEHPTVSRVFQKINESLPREKYHAFANCPAPAKQKPKKRFVHKRRKLTQPGGDDKYNSNSGTTTSTTTTTTTTTTASRPRKRKVEATPQTASPERTETTDVPGAKMYLFEQRPAIKEAARLITETNHRVSRQLNRLCEKRKVLDIKFKKLTERARHFAEVEGKALLADKSDRDYLLEKLESDLKDMAYKAFYAEHQTKQYTRLLRRSKQLARGVARNVVQKQGELGRWTEPLGGHVARARAQVLVENTAWSLETKNLEKLRSEYFEEIRDRAQKLSALRQNTTDQKLAIALEEKAVVRREAIRKTALLEMAEDENKRLVSRAIATTSKRKMTKRSYIKLLTALSKFQALMQRLETSTGVVGIDAVVKRWFERDEREKSLRADEAQYQDYIEKCQVELAKMNEKLGQFQTFGTDTAYTHRESRAFEKLLASQRTNLQKSTVLLQKSSKVYNSKSLHLGLVAECLRSLCVRFKLDDQARLLSKQLNVAGGYVNSHENKLLAKRLTQCLGGLDRTICNMGRSILTGTHEDNTESFVAAESKAKAAAEEHRHQQQQRNRGGGGGRGAAPPPTAPPTAPPAGTMGAVVLSASTTSNQPTSSDQMTAGTTGVGGGRGEDELIYGLKSNSKRTMRQLQEERSKRTTTATKISTSSTVVQDMLPSGSALSLLDLPCPQGANIRVPTKKERSVGDQITTNGGSGPMQRITHQLLEQVHYNGIKWAQVFQAIDIDGSGQIRRSEFGQVLRDLGIKVAQSDLELLMERFDNNRDDKLDYEEFLLMVGDRQVDDDLGDSSDEDGNFEDDIAAAAVVQKETENQHECSSSSSSDFSVATSSSSIAATETTTTPVVRRQSIKGVDIVEGDGKVVTKIGDGKSGEGLSSNSLSGKLASAVTLSGTMDGSGGSPVRPVRSRTRKASASRKMAQNIRDSEMNRKKMRRDKERQAKKSQKDLELQKNIRSAVSAIRAGKGKVAAPPGFFRRSDRKEWSAQVAAAGVRKNARNKGGIDKTIRPPTLLERHAEAEKKNRAERESKKKEEELEKTKEAARREEEKEETVDA